MATIRFFLPLMATTIPTLVLLFIILGTSSSASEFWYIDCGNSKGFNNPVGITYSGDGDFVRSGERKETKDGKYSNGDTFYTLRAFPKNKKNCYTIPVGKDRKIEVSVAFYYGNYDGKSQPPTFQLLLDSNNWVRIDMTDSADGLMTETIYETTGNSTSICLGRLYDDQDPFISAIKISVLDPRLYSGVNSSYALDLPTRTSLGTNTSIRYPDDRYDRYWSGIEDSGDTISKYAILNSDTTVVNTSTSIDDPPAKMFSSAVTSLGISKNLTITTSFLRSIPKLIYLNMYFAEIPNSLNGSKQRRSFYIYMDDAPISDPIMPPSGQVLEFTRVNLLASENTSFTLVPANDSTLPPIISGFEVLRVVKFSLASTDYHDVNALSRLQGHFTVLQNWTGDPCLPSDYNWEWVGCNSNDSPRITSLYLDGYGLEGSLPDFSELVALETIDVHNNSLNGSIPEFLATLPNLRKLNLAYNNFSSVPPSLSNNKRIILNIKGNPQIDPTPAPSPKDPTGSSEGNGVDTLSDLAPLIYMLMSMIVGWA